MIMIVAFSGLIVSACVVRGGRVSVDLGNAGVHVVQEIAQG
jgi:hypothetical protein